MKKILLGMFIILLVGCSLDLSNSPKERVKEYLDKYKEQDSKVLSDLDESIGSEYSGDYKDRYKSLMINQYKNLTYEITEEIIEEDEAIVTVDINVYDYAKALEYSSSYLSKHRDEFITKTDSEEDSTKANIDNDKYTKFKLDEMEKVSDRRKYTINFTLKKNNDNKWELQQLSNNDIKKIHGLYEE